MTDADLAKGLCLTEVEAAIVIPKLTPDKRATYERMIQFGADWNLYAAGVGPRPTGALVDTERSMKRCIFPRSIFGLMRGSGTSIATIGSFTGQPSSAGMAAPATPTTPATKAGWRGCAQRELTITPQARPSLLENAQ